MEAEKAEDRKGRIALISDIHANLVAFEAVLEQIARQDVRTIVCLGDIIGYGPDPAACVELVMERCAACVLGNHEVMMFMAGAASEGEFGRRIGEPLALAHRQLGSRQMRWLKEQPLVIDAEEMVFVHSALPDPIAFDYIFDKDSAREHFQAQTHEVCFYGHTHIPAIWQRGKRGGVKGEHPYYPRVLARGLHYAINPGGVGQPRDGDPRAAYALYQPATRRIEHHRVAYDVPAAQARYQAAGLPDSNWERLAAGR